MIYHMIAFAAGFVLDLFLGDPPSLPHPVRWMGWMIAGTERCLRHGRRRESMTGSRIAEETQEQCNGNARALRRGVWLVLIVTGASCIAAAAALLSAYLLHPWAGVCVEGIMTYQFLAAKSLKTESMKVCAALERGDPCGARAALSMIVGRDTETLDEEGIVRAAVETVAENTSDGVVAPMLFLALGGPVLGAFYKAVNTMDSMVGYQNETYLYFGRAAAKLDDALNFLPARISAWLMLAAAFLGGRHFSAPGAYRIYRRDRKKHASPNAAQTESVCAGALGLRLGGDARYFGEPVHKPYIGDKLRRAEAKDIRLANRLMYLSAWLCQGGCLLAMAVCVFLGQGFVR